MAKKKITAKTKTATPIVATPTPAAVVEKLAPAAVSSPWSVGPVATSLEDLAVTTGSNTKMSGSSAVYSYGGRLVSFERKPELQHRNLFTTYDNVIANTTIVGAAIRYFGNLIGGTAWSVEAKQDTPSQAIADQAAEIVKEGLFASPMTMPWA